MTLPLRINYFFVAASLNKPQNFIIKRIGNKEKHLTWRQASDQTQKHYKKANLQTTKHTFVDLLSGLAAF